MQRNTTFKRITDNGVPVTLNASISFCANVVLVQPVKLVLLAVCCALKLGPVPTPTILFATVGKAKLAERHTSKTMLPDWSAVKTH
jgi:hypothetical protein